MSGSCVAGHEALGSHCYYTNISRAVPYAVAQCSCVAYGYSMGHGRPPDDCSVAMTLRVRAVSIDSPKPPTGTASLRPLHAPSQSRRAIYRPRAERYAKREPTARGRIGSHVGRNPAHLGRGEGGVAILTHFFTFISIFRGGRGSRGGLLHRAGGGSSVGKRGKIPLLTLLTAFYLAFYDFYLWKIVEFCKNRHLSQ